jgi:hypothetical protein
MPSDLKMAVSFGKTYGLEFETGDFKDYILDVIFR